MKTIVFLLLLSTYCLRADEFWGKRSNVNVSASSLPAQENAIHEQSKKIQGDIQQLINEMELNGLDEMDAKTPGEVRAALATLNGEQVQQLLHLLEDQPKDSSELKHASELFSLQTDSEVQFQMLAAQLAPRASQKRLLVHLASMVARQLTNLRQINMLLPAQSLEQLDPDRTALFKIVTARQATLEREIQLLSRVVHIDTTNRQESEPPESAMARAVASGIDEVQLLPKATAANSITQSGPFSQAIELQTTVLTQLEFLLKEGNEALFPIPDRVRLALKLLKNIAEQQKQLANNASASKSNAAAPESKASAPEGNAAAPNSNAAAPESNSSAPKSTASASKASAAAPESNPAAPKSTASASKASAAAPESNSSAPKSNVSASKASAAAPESNPAAPKSSASGPEGNALPPEGSASADDKSKSSEPGQPSQLPTSGDSVDSEGRGLAEKQAELADSAEVLKMLLENFSPQAAQTVEKALAAMKQNAQGMKKGAQPMKQSAQGMKEGAQDMKEGDDANAVPPSNEAANALDAAIKALERQIAALDSDNNGNRNKGGQKGRDYDDDSDAEGEGGGGKGHGGGVDPAGEPASLAAVLGNLTPKDRDAISQYQKEKTPPQYDAAVQQYFKNLDDTSKDND